MRKIALAIMFVVISLYANYHGDVPCVVRYIHDGKFILNKMGFTQQECDNLQSQKQKLIMEYESTAPAPANTAYSPKVGNANSATIQGCGLNGDSIDSSSLRFFENMMPKGLENLSLDDFKFDSFDAISGFKCPAYEDLPTAKKGVKAEATISDIDFYTGDYTCTYNFLDSKSFYKIRLNNKSCKTAISASIKESNDIKKMPSIIFANYGPYKYEDLSAYRKSENYPIFYFSKNIKDVYTKFESGIESLQNERNKKKSFIDIKNDLDSHNQFQYTLPSLITGILTTDPQFFQRNIIGENGDLMIRPTPAIFSQKEGVASFVDTIDRKLWGFYYYLMENMGNSFGKIITIIFGIGTVGIFSFAALMKTSGNELENFNFLKKFIGVFAAFTIFAAPIVPTNHNLPKQFVYDKDGISIANDISKNSTVIKTLLRYVFQTGTFWANTVNDYGYYSYLKYIENNYGNFKTDKLLKNYQDDVSVLLQKQVLLKEKLNFFERTCGYNYYSILQGKQDLPNYYGGQSNGVNFLRDNPLGFVKVDYNYCSKLYHQIQQTTKDNLLDYRFALDRYDQIADKIDSINHYDLEHMNNFLTEAVGYDNALGWMSVALVPSLTQIFEAKDILKYTDSYNSEGNNKLIDVAGSVEQKQENLIKDKNDELFKGESKKSWLTKIWESTKEKAKEAGQAVGNAYNRSIAYLTMGSGNVMGWAAAKGMYSIFPGFKDVKDNIQNSQIAQIIENGVGFVLSKIPGLNVVSKLSSLAGTDGNKSVITYLIVYTLAILLYGFIISTLALMIISALIIIKIIYYYIEVIVAVFVSLAVMLWSLVFDKNQAYSSIGEFFYKVMILAFTPMTIVLSVYVYIFSKATMYWLYSLLMEAIYHISTTSGMDVKGNSLTGAFTQVQIYAIYNLGDIILSFLSIFLAYSIIFSFHNWMLDYFGHKGESGLKKGFDHVMDEFKHRALSRA